MVTKYLFSCFELFVCFFYSNVWHGITGRSLDHVFYVSNEQLFPTETVTQHICHMLASISEEIITAKFCLYAFCK